MRLQVCDDLREPVGRHRRGNICHQQKICDDMEDKIITAFEATRNSKGKGDTPAGLKRWIDKLRKAKVRWERIFHRYVGQALAKDDYSFTRVNKRFLGQDMYLPDLRSYTIGNVVIAIDTSGSYTG